MVRRLIIDDERNFPKLDGDITYIRSSTEAVDHLWSNSSYDEIWLDHDLGDDDTIRPVVLALQEMAWKSYPPTNHIVIHTMNPVGREYIRSALQRFYNITDVLVEDYL